MLEKLLGINLNHLVVLSVVLEEANVTRAAKRLGLTQSATSHALAVLRTEFEDELLVRTNRGMQPTEYALELLPALQRALSDLSDVISTRSRFEPRTSTRSFSIACADFLVAPLGRELGHQFARKLPHGSLRIEPTRLENLADRVLARELDLALAPPVVLDPALSWEVILEEPWVSALSADHPLAKKIGLNEPLSVEAFVSLDHILVSPSGRGASFVDKELERLGKKRRIGLRFTSFSNAGAAIVGSRSVLTAPRSLFRGLQRKVRLFPPPLAIPPLELALYFEKTRARQPDLRWLVGEVKRALALVVG